MNTPDTNSWDDPAWNDPDWDDLFRERLADYEAEPAPDALERILLNVNGPSPQPVSGGRWWLAAVGLLLLSGSGWLISEIHYANKTSVKAEVGQPVAGTGVGKSEINGDGLPVPSLGNEPAPEGQRVAKPALDTYSEALVPTRSDAGSPRPGSPQRINREQTGRADQPSQNRVNVTKIIAEKNRPARMPPEENLTSFRNSRLQASPVRRITAMDRRQLSEKSALTTGSGYETDVTLPTLSDRTARPDAWSVAALTALPVRLQPWANRWPEINAASVPTQASLLRSARNRPGLYVSVMPLYSYRNINPVATDEVYVGNIRQEKTFASGRTGWRTQIGVEWTLGRQLSLRTGLTYGQMQQSLNYSVSPIAPDSARIELIDAQTVRVTPIRTTRPVAETTRYHYAGLNADLLWRLSAGGSWRPFVTAGATVGGYVAPVWQPGGFVQASIGVERPLTSRLWLRVEPTVQYGWNPVSDKQNLFQIRPYTYGLTIGLGIR
ncbi:hypothetical protein HNV11_19665 [Spirosoma taeanense]|uniref:Outer membrane protein beta-barrel domain-containing protein n=1 Tax=Spirosoma taeanense TaxID=2735870 RepID=A0A6M5YBB0_9BACT|nr:hypothetical protein [Spirosoma taeanense]QJW91437.1 hypothetical protein HNV11_19665 [Spirosoma taeanense]